MSRKTREMRLEAERSWPNLCQFLGSYFHQDLYDISGSVEGALDEAIEGWSTEGRRLVLREWRDWNAKRGCTGDNEASLDAMGVDLFFGSEENARTFMNHIYERVIESVRRDIARKRRAWPS